jgi:hypothetical protein
MSIVGNILGGIMNVVAAKKKKTALKRARRLQVAMEQLTLAKTLDDIEDQVTLANEEIRVKEKQIKGRQQLFYAAAGVDLTSRTPMSQFILTETRATTEKQRIRKEADEEITYTSKMASLENTLGNLQYKNAKKEITANAWSSMLGSTSSSVSGYLGNYQSRTSAGQTGWTATLGSLWGG